MKAQPQVQSDAPSQVAILESRSLSTPSRLTHTLDQVAIWFSEVAPNAWTLRLGSRCSRLWADEEFGGYASRVK